MANLTELVFQPTFEKNKTEGTRGPDERDDAAAIKTYRYLRLGMFVIVIGLLASVLIQRWNSGCWQDSISAYYYTPARPIFVSGLLAIGVSLIMIKGSTVVEDLLLNFAGVLAPIVAFVPTNFEPSCTDPSATGPSSLPPEIVRDVQNNIEALLVAGAAAFVIAAVVFVLEQRGDDRLATGHVKSRVGLLAFTALLLVVGAWLLATDTILDLHGYSAVLMFGLLALASIFNGLRLFRIDGRRDTKSLRLEAFAMLYVAVGVVMVIAGIVIKFVWPEPWEHRVLILEMVEIGLFASMWLVQSAERWGKILQAKA